MKSLGEVLSHCVTYLGQKKIPHARRIAEAILVHVLRKNRIGLYTQFECPLEEEELSSIRQALKRASLQEPIEYILSQVEFYGLVLTVTPDVLIPRQETEILVDKAAEIIAREAEEGAVVWDLCCGSGCIGLSIKNKFPGLQVVLSDISEKALAVCLANKEKLAIEAECRLGDLLQPFSDEKAKYIFCNPPYIASSEYADLQPSVRDFEPKQALIAGESGLELYQRLASELPAYLVKGGKVFLEIGSGQGNSIRELFSAPCWVKKELFLDYAGHDRFFFLEIE